MRLRYRHQYVWPRIICIDQSSNALAEVLNNRFHCSKHPISFHVRKVYRFNPISAAITGLDFRHRKIQPEKKTEQCRKVSRKKTHVFWVRAHVLWSSPTQNGGQHNVASILFTRRLGFIHSISSINCSIVGSGMLEFEMERTKHSKRTIWKERKTGLRRRHTDKKIRSFRHRLPRNANQQFYSWNKTRTSFCIQQQQQQTWPGDAFVHA